MNTPVSPSRTPHRRLLSSVYFLLFLGLAAVVPYLALYLSEEAQFSGTQIGLLLSVGPVIGLLATPFWTGLADVSKRHTIILTGAVAGAALLYALVPFVPNFPLMLVLFVGIAFLASHLLPMQDSATVHMLGEFKSRYGQVRFWGTLGWGLGGLVFGWLIDFTGLAWMFWICGFFLLLALPAVLRMQFDQTPSQSSSFFVNLKELIRKAPIQLFLFATVLAAIGLSTHNNYLSLLLNEFSGGAAAQVFGLSIPLAQLIGYIVVLGVLSELPVMLYSERLLARLGTRGLVVTSLLVIAARNLLYAVNDQIWPILLVQCLHGLTYALLWVGGVSFMARHAPKGLSSTAQGLFSAAQAGVGYAAGNLFGGLLIDIAGVQGMFAVSGVVVLLGFGLLLLLDRRYRIF